MSTICNRGAIIAIVLNLGIFMFSAHAFEGQENLLLLALAIFNLVLEMVLSPRIFSVPVSVLAAIVLSMSMSGHWFEMGAGALLFIGWFVDKKVKMERFLAGPEASPIIG